MTQKIKEEIMVSEHLMEIRHGAIGSFLDVRGLVADYIRNEHLFDHWKIDIASVHFRDTQEDIKKDGAFAGYKNAGYIVFDPPTKNYFIDKAIKFWEVLIKNKHYRISDVERLGLRTKIFIHYGQRFEGLRQKIYETLYTDKMNNIVGNFINDFQFTMELKDGDYDVRMSGGPMHENEAEKLFDFSSDQFKTTGFFIDLDYFINSNIELNQIPQHIRIANDLMWSKIERVKETLGI